MLRAIIFGDLIGRLGVPWCRNRGRGNSATTGGKNIAGMNTARNLAALEASKSGPSWGASSVTKYQWRRI
jgi:hypothetical protein